MPTFTGLDNINDPLTGTPLPDIFQPGTSFDKSPGDTVDGNDGDDELEIDYSSDTSGIGISSPGTVDGIISSGDFAVTYTSIEQFDIIGTNFNDQLAGGSLGDHLEGREGNDLIDGNDGNDVLNGGLGSDTLRGGNGNDTISGEDGKDVLNGGQGNDTLNGGPGVDFYIIDSRGDLVTENAGEGTDTVITTLNNYILPQNVENLVLNEARTARVGTGNNLKNRIIGNSQHNRLYGEAGIDIIKGLDGNDRLFGGADKDLISGGDGNDTLQGDGGRDRLTGGDGRDRFRFNAANEGPDTIVDFEAGPDFIEISRSGFGLPFTTGRIPEESFVLGSRALDADDLFIYNDASGQLIFDANGNAAGGRSIIASLGAGTNLGRTNIRLFA